MRFKKGRFKRGEKVVCLCRSVTNIEYGEVVTVKWCWSPDPFKEQYISTYEKKQKLYLAGMFQIVDLDNKLASLKDQIAVYAQKIVDYQKEQDKELDEAIQKSIDEENKKRKK